MNDPFATFKDRQREMWASFGPTATFTTQAAAHLVRFAGISRGEAVLDVGTGTGPVAITAARTGARVSGMDLTPALIEQAIENAALAGVDVAWQEGDAEHLPYPDASFDVVVSQFGHMFAPRPELAVAEMRRVLKPSGRIAFATWPPNLLVGQIFGFIARNMPPPPPGVSPPHLWGDDTVVVERLAGKFGEPTFERGAFSVPALSLPHYRAFMERSVGPMQRLVEGLAGDPERLATMRGEFEAIVAPYYDGNLVRQEYLLTRAAAR
ncbi:MAG TPA: class I SAM-dependent methyltransferase [Candidatus Binatia bacterium]|nr:class I SAM-dependent methyltransferase [Candidatus Binatia bacterium]